MEFERATRNDAVSMPGDATRVDDDSFDRVALADNDGDADDDDADIVDDGERSVAAPLAPVPGARRAAR